jgi:proline iminopeptidase
MFWMPALMVMLSPYLAAQSMQEGQVPRDGFVLHYRTTGSGRSLLLLSGGPGIDIDYLTPIATELSSSYSTILLEQRGTGRSRPKTLTPENLNLRLLVEDIEALRTSIGADRLLILGHSWGGVLALAYASAHPERVDSIILVASGGIDGSFAPVFMDNILARASMGERRKIQELDAMLGHAAEKQAAWTDLLHMLVPYYFFDRELGEKFISAANPGSFHADTSQVLQEDILKNYHVGEELKRLRRPVLILQGHQDPMPESVAEQTHAIIQGSQLAFLNRCGHFPWLEQPSAFYEQVRSFLEAAQK